MVKRSYIKLSNNRIVALSALLLSCLTIPNTVSAARISDITNTKHNLSTTPSLVNRNVQATSEAQICVFCHTPHKSENIPDAPLWNRADYTETYTPYTSNTIDANDIAATPGGSSKLCLSCHDGTIAIGNVNVVNVQENVTIAMTGTGAGGEMPVGEGEQTGYTRKLGLDLRNDHPISFTYDTTLANADGELRDPATESHIGNRSPGNNHPVPLQDNKVQCTSCHDPHIRDTDINLNVKFLRLNRFQNSTPAGGAFDETNDIVCLACHDKLGTAWSASAHADPISANETYTTAAANIRDFPDNLPVWKASCLNCHDTHTVQGARRLLREGTDSLSSPKSGGNAAQEEACYTCHSDDGGVLVNQANATFEVPDIKTDFTTSNVRMPITTSDQNQASEVHDINDADFIEDASNLNGSNRHVECTDCHNPHRVMKNRLFNGTGATTAGTHDHSAGHTNIASGVLRGTWGVEPVYGSRSFTSLPSNFTVKSGDGGQGASTALASTHVTREYQVCMKCHSDYAYGINPPMLGNTQNGTSPNTNNLSQYTNQAMEFQSPDTHQGEINKDLGTDGGAHSDYNTNNHRSWHPVMNNTGRTPTERGGISNNIWLSPWNGGSDIGNQTMYCSDCHGSQTGSQTVEPTGGENGNPWGPHGSDSNFLLKGDWDSSTGDGSSNDLCFKCHNYDAYGDAGASSGFESGFDTSRGNGHHVHNTGDKLGSPIRCSWCHIAIPHGWKNKAFLANLNDVGPEVGEVAGTEINQNQLPYNNGPYYMNSYLKIINFRASGVWSDTDCGSATNQGDEPGVKWMKATCSGPP